METDVGRHVLAAAVHAAADLNADVVFGHHLGEFVAHQVFQDAGQAGGVGHAQGAGVRTGAGRDVGRSIVAGQAQVEGVQPVEQVGQRAGRHVAQDHALLYAEAHVVAGELLDEAGQQPGLLGSEVAQRYADSDGAVASLLLLQYVGLQPGVVERGVQGFGGAEVIGRHLAQGGHFGFVDRVGGVLDGGHLFADQLHEAFQTKVLQ